MLLYALNGGVSTDGVTPAVDQAGNRDYTTYGANDITDPSLFKEKYERLIKSLTAKGTEGVVANIPELTSLPYFTIVEWNDIELNVAQLQELSPFVSAFNQALDAAQQSGLIADAALRKLHYREGQSNPFFVVDTDLKDISAELMPTFKSLLTAQGGNLRQSGAVDKTTRPSPPSAYRGILSSYLRLAS